MKLIANKPVRYAGKRHAAGAEFEADDKWGDLLQRTGQARLADSDQSAPKRGRGRPKGSHNKPTVPVTTADITHEDLNTADEQDDE